MSGEYDYLVQYTPEEIYGVKEGITMRQLGLCGFIPIEMEPEEIIKVALERGYDVTHLRDPEREFQDLLISPDMERHQELLALMVIKKQGRLIPLVGSNCVGKLRKMLYEEKLEREPTFERI